MVSSNAGIRNRVYALATRTHSGATCVAAQTPFVQFDGGARTVRFPTQNIVCVVVLPGSFVWAVFWQRFMNLRMPCPKE